jgi:hypothetical protein
MSYLRAVRNYKSFLGPTFDLSDVIERLKSRDGTPPSVYVVDGHPMAIRVITLYGMSYKAQPEKLDFVLLPHRLILEFSLTLRADPTGLNHPLLANSHFELLGLEIPGKLDLFANALSVANIDGRRLTPGELKANAAQEIIDPIHGEAARKLVEGRPGWSFLFQ